MALGQVAARIEGDVFQGMFFWLEASKLLRPTSRVARVVLEYDKAAGVDDVAVQYAAPGIDACGRRCAADYYQIKYHVDRSSSYSASSFCDPGFIGATRSLLQRFQDARLRLGDAEGWHRLHLVSNWGWAPDDALCPVLRESDEGALPDRFFSAGPRSALGKIRNTWREHLELGEQDFEDFARRLRLGVDRLGRRGLKESLNDRLFSVGLREISSDHAHNPYDSLTQQFLMNGTNEFDPESFRAMCAQQGLFADSAPPVGPPVIGIRSFMRFAERMEDECASFVCVATAFEGRHLRAQREWREAVVPAVKTFLNDPSFRGAEHHLLLECHTSVAFLAGYELDRKSGAEVFPVQKGVRRGLWKPSMTLDGTVSDRPGWEVNPHSVSSSAPDVAVAVSVARDVLADVTAFAATIPSLCAIVDVRVAEFGPRAVVDADHAVALADALAEVIRRHRPSTGATVHLFIAAPNGLTFFLAQHRAALGRVQLYEFDFDGAQGGSYTPSLRLPE